MTDEFFNVPLLNERLIFPPADQATPEGIVAFGGDLNTSRLQLAYASGIFPWFEDDELLIWWSPDPRMVLFPSELKISKSLARTLRKNRFRVSFDQAFPQVIRACAQIGRKGQPGTWITEGMQQAYIELHKMGFARSVEVWEGEELVGGLYGIDLQGVFCGESMFARVSDASKVGFVVLVQELERRNYAMIDCQVYTDHLSSLGAREIPRRDFLRLLSESSRFSRALRPDNS